MKNEQAKIALAESKLQARKQKLAEKEARRASKEVRKLEADLRVLERIREESNEQVEDSAADTLVGIFEVRLEEARASALAPKAGAV